MTLKELLSDAEIHIFAERNGARFRLQLENQGGEVGVQMLSKPIPSAREDLTAREREVIDLLMQGHSYRTISEQLIVSEGTVKKTAHNAYQKLNVSSRMQLMHRMM